MKIKTIYFSLFPVEKKNETSPSWKLMAKSEDGQFVEVGAAWEKQGKNVMYGSGKFNKGLELIGEVEVYQPKKNIEVSEKELDNIPF